MRCSLTKGTSLKKDKPCVTHGTVAKHVILLMCDEEIPPSMEGAVVHKISTASEWFVNRF